MPISSRKYALKDGTVIRKYRADAGISPVTGKRLRKDFDLRKDALEWLHHHDKKSLSNNFTGEMTLRSLGEKYVDSHKELCAESTWTKYQQHFRNHINVITITDGPLKGMVLGDALIAALQSSHFEQYQEDLRRALSPAMARKVWRTLCAAMTYAVRKQYLTGSPTVSVKLGKDKRKSSKEVEDGDSRGFVRPPKVDLAALVAKIRREPGEAPTLGLVYVEFALKTGLRPSEQIALRWSDLVLDGTAPSVSVRRAVDEKGNVCEPKSKAGYRTLPIPSSLVETLTLWKKACPPSPMRLVFPSGAGTHQSRPNLHNRVWVPLLKAANLVDPVINEKGRHEIGGDGSPIVKHRYKLYWLRHVYASMQIDLGLSLKGLQQRMGHSTVRMTLDIYGNLFDRGEHAADDAMKMNQWIENLPFDQIPLE